MTLWINECGLKTMGPALKGCKKLKAVHMCNNNIRTIEQLDDMPSLEGKENGLFILNKLLLLFYTY